MPLAAGGQTATASVLPTRSTARPAALAAFLNVAAFDFFFVPPKLTFAVQDTEYVFTFAVMLLTALVTSTLTA